MSIVIEPDVPVKPPSVDINVNDSLSAGAIAGICLGIIFLFLLLGACVLILYWASRAKANATLQNGVNPAAAVNGDGAKQVGVASPKSLLKREHHHKRKKSSRKKLLVLKKRSSFQSAAAASGKPFSSAFSGQRGSSARSLKPSSAGSRKSSAFSRKSSALSKKGSRLSKKGSRLSKKGSKASRKTSKASKKSAKSSLKHSFGFKKGPQGFTVTPNGLKAPLALKKQAPDGALKYLGND